MIIQPGVRIDIDGIATTVVLMNGQNIVCRDAHNDLTGVSLEDLMFDRTGTYIVHDEAEVSAWQASRADWDTAPRTRTAYELAKARFDWMESGKLADDLPGSYPDLANRTARASFLADTLGVSLRTIWTRYGAYKTGDRIGAVGARHKADHRAHPSVDDRYLTEAKALARERLEAGAGKLSQRAFHAQLQQRVKRIAKTENLHIKIPAKTVRYEVVAESLKRAGTFDGTIKRQEGNASRTNREYGRIEATRPGQFVLIDTTRLDVHALSIFSNRWHHVELTVAVDLYSRAVLASRLSPISTDGTDIALLLHDLFHPRREQWAFHSGKYLPTAGVPNYLLINSTTGEFDDGTSGDDDLIATVQPETLVTDNGKVFISEQVHTVCNANGISILRGRVVKGSDKGQVEAFFRTLRNDLLAYLSGYKGNDSGAHGRHAEVNAVFSLEELDDIVRQYIIGYYHRTEHSGLSPFGIPGQSWSPIEKLQEGVVRAGIRITNRSKQLAIDLLPIRWATIQHYGVQVRKLRYDGDFLKEYVGVKSGYAGKKGKWPIAYNPQDRQNAYIQDPETGEWRTLRWIGSKSFSGPFSTSMMMRSIQLSAQNTGKRFARVGDDDAIADALSEWVDLIDAAADLPPEHDRILLRVAGYREPFRAFDLSVQSLRSLFAVRSRPLGPKHRSDTGPTKRRKRGRRRLEADMELAKASAPDGRVNSQPSPPLPAAATMDDDYWEGTY